MVVGDHIGYRFEILSRLGKGSFGQVAVLPFAALTCTCHHTCSIRSKKAPSSVHTPISSLRSQAHTVQHIVPYIPNCNRLSCALLWLFL